MIHIFLAKKKEFETRAAKLYATIPYALCYRFVYLLLEKSILRGLNPWTSSDASSCNTRETHVLFDLFLWFLILKRMSTRTSTGNQNRTSTGNQNRTVPKYGIRTKPALPSSPASDPAPQPSPPAQAWTASRAPALFILVRVYLYTNPLLIK